MSYKIILRTKPSPYTLGNDVTKKSVLSHKELDNNIINLKGKLSKDVEVQGNDLIIKKVDGSSITTTLSGVTGSGDDIYVTGGTYDNSTGLITFSNNDGSDFDVDLGTIDLNDTYITGGTYDNSTGIITFENNDGNIFDLDISSLDLNDTFVTGGTYDNNTESVTFTNNDGSTFTVDLSTLDINDTFITGGTFDNSNEEITFTNNDGNSFGVDLSNLDLNDTFTTAATLNNNTLVFDTTDQVSAYTVDLSGITIEPAGNDEEVQFNESGSFGADPTFKFHRSQNAFTLGHRTGTIGNDSVVLGGTNLAENKASGTLSFASGWHNTSSGPYSFSIGEGGPNGDSEASGTGSFIGGGVGSGNGKRAHGEGSFNFSNNTDGYSGNGVESSGSAILGGFDNEILNSTLGGSIILGGNEHLINGSGSRSGILGGTNNIISGVTNSVVLGGNSITATEANTTYVPNLNIDSDPNNGAITGTTSLVRNDSTGNVEEIPHSQINNSFKYAETIPSSSTGTVTTITHNLNDEDVIVQLWKNNNELIGGTINNKTANSVDVSFDADPAADVRVVVKV